MGKTLIAEQLHQFYQVKMNQEVPFIYFNCAEYFNNPELLTSHLFGYKKAVSLVPSMTKRFSGVGRWRFLF